MEPIEYDLVILHEKQSAFWTQKQSVRKITMCQIANDRKSDRYRWGCQTKTTPFFLSLYIVVIILHRPKT